MRKKFIGKMLLATLICALWATSALAVPTYILSGYTGSFTVLNPDDESLSADAYGAFSVVFTGGTADSATQVSGLSGLLSFAQDLTGTPTPVNGGPNPWDFNLPHNSSRFGGRFDDSFIFSYDTVTGFLDLTTDLSTPSMLSMDVGLGFNLLALTTVPLDLTNTFFSSEGIVGNIGDNAIDFTTDELTYQATVPEPSTLALLGMGLVGFGIWRRRKV